MFLIQNGVIILKHVKLLFKYFIYIYHIIVTVYNLGIIDMLLFIIGLIFLIKLYICGAAIWYDKLLLETVKLASIVILKEFTNNC